MALRCRHSSPCCACERGPGSLASCPVRRTSASRAIRKRSFRSPVPKPSLGTRDLECGGSTPPSILSGTAAENLRRPLSSAHGIPGSTSSEPSSASNDRRTYEARALTMEAESSLSTPRRAPAPKPSLRTSTGACGFAAPNRDLVPLSVPVTTLPTLHVVGLCPKSSESLMRRLFPQLLVARGSRSGRAPQRSLVTGSLGLVERLERRLVLSAADYGQVSASCSEKSA